MFTVWVPFKDKLLFGNTLYNITAQKYSVWEDFVYSECPTNQNTVTVVYYMLKHWSFCIALLVQIVIPRVLSVKRRHWKIIVPNNECKKGATGR